MAEPPRPSDPEAKAAPDEGQASLDPARARGRRVAYVLFYSIAVGISAAGAIQIFSQAFARHGAPESAASTCEEGLSRLASAVARARKAASATDGEDAALGDFRKTLRPEWDDRDHVEDLCRSSPSSMAALDAIEQLRYAEEHAVRREAAELAPLRRRVQSIIPQGEAADSPPPAPPGSASGTSPHSP